MKTKLILLLACIFIGCKSKNKFLFTQIATEHSNLYFENTIAENAKYNVYDYHNLYNGGGVAAVDINNDGLEDLYFTGNQVPDKLYLNKGDFKFEDISEQAGIASLGWSTGVSITDINGDGLADIYICKAGNETANLKANIFWINDGNNHFHNEAVERGLADTSWSTQSAFFDFDHDGDLDMYLLTTSNLLRNPNLLHKPDQYGMYARDKLFENDGSGHFNEVGIQKGITKNTHGLGLNITDINGDGWEDILASSDFLPNDALYINNQDGTFTEKSSEVMPYQSRFSMGNDIADLNNDGRPEIISTDMLPPDNEQQKRMLMTSYHVFETEKNLGYQNEFTRNMLFQNLGKDINRNLKLGEIGQYAGIHATDWSWSPLMVDFDNDGLKDVVISNGYLRDVTDADYVAYNMSFANKTQSSEEMKKFMNKGAENLPKLYKKNQFFRNKGSLLFENVSDTWLLSKGSFSNGAIFVDLDNNGTMDYVVNNINEPAGIFRNNGTKNYLKVKLIGQSKNLFGQGAKVEISIKGNSQTQFQNLSRGYLSSVDPQINFGCDDAKKIDAITIIWPGGKSQTLHNLPTNQLISFDEKEAIEVPNLEKSDKPLFKETNSNYSHLENRFIDYYRENLLLHMYSTPGPSLTIGDVNGDKLDDIFIAGSSIQRGTFMFQDKSGNFEQKKYLPLQIAEDAACLLFDLNNDGFKDLYLVAGTNEFPENAENYQDRLFINDGKGNFRDETNSKIPKIRIPGSTICALDIDQDGDIDIFRGGTVKPGQFPYSTESFLLINENNKFRIQTLGNLGLITDVQSVDFNDDTWPDLVLVGEYMQPLFLKNENGVLKQDFKIKDSRGLWNCIESADLDNDGDLDFVLGNIGLNYRYKFNQNHPLKINTSTFDQGNTFQAIPSYCLDNQEVPIPSRDDLIRQIPAVRKKFPDYNSYAVSKIYDWLKPEKGQIFQAELMESIILRNQGNGSFEMEKLPEYAQMSPVRDILIFDVNNDGIPDILFGGNDYDLEPTNSGYVAGNAGFFMLGKKNGSYEKMDNGTSGVWLNGPLKKLSLINKKSSPIILAAFNNSPVKLFRSSSN